MTTTNTFDINQLSLSAKRDLVKALKESIKQSVTIQKHNRVLIKQNKEAEKKAKVLAQIKAAEDKLARLTAKLSV
jgi:antitoxin component of MazEF toxin-antitoxin module